MPSSQGPQRAVHKTFERYMNYQSQIWNTAPLSSMLPNTTVVNFLNELLVAAKSSLGLQKFMIEEHAEESRQTLFVELARVWAPVASGYGLPSGEACIRILPSLIANHCHRIKVRQAVRALEQGLGSIASLLGIDPLDDSESWRPLTAPSALNQKDVLQLPEVTTGTMFGLYTPSAANFLTSKSKQQIFLESMHIFGPSSGQGSWSKSSTAPSSWRPKESQGGESFPPAGSVLRSMKLAPLQIVPWTVTKPVPLRTGAGIPPET